MKYIHNFCVITACQSTVCKHLSPLTFYYSLQIKTEIVFLRAGWLSRCSLQIYVVRKIKFGIWCSDQQHIRLWFVSSALASDHNTLFHYFFPCGWFLHSWPLLLVCLIGLDNVSYSSVNLIFQPLCIFIQCVILHFSQS